MTHILSTDFAPVAAARPSSIRSRVSSYVGSLLVLSGLLTGTLALCVLFSLARVL